MTFMDAPWLVAEAYKYRRLRECFAVSKYWKEYDVFFRQKVCAGTTDKWTSISVWLTSLLVYSAIPSRVLKTPCLDYRRNMPSRSRSPLMIQSSRRGSKD